MGPQHGQRLQRAWKWVRIYAYRHPKFTREQIFAMAKTDPSRDIYTDEHEIVEYILHEFDVGCDVETLCSKANVLRTLPHANSLFWNKHTNI